jgi:hypothetical protein
MRFVKNIENSFCKASIYSFNNKWVLRFEAEPFEQIFKFSETDVFEPKEIEDSLTESFYLSVIKRFEDMQKDYESLDEIWDY